MPANKSQIRFLVTILAIVWGFLVGTNALLADWSVPSAEPPLNQPSPFLSTDNTAQTKTGPLTIDSYFYVTGSGVSGLVGLGTTTVTSARLVIAPYTNTSINAGDGAILTSRTPIGNYEVVNLAYLDAALSSSLDPLKYWALSGNNLFASSTGWNVGVGTITPTAKLHLNAGSNEGLRIISSAGNFSPLIVRNANDSLDYLRIKETGDILFGGNNRTARRQLDISGSGLVIDDTATTTNYWSIYDDGTYGRVSYGSVSGWFGPSSIYYNLSGSTTNSLFVRDSSSVTKHSLTAAGDAYHLGKLAVGTSTLSASGLNVVGNGYFTGPVVVGTPTQDNHAVTKSYLMDTISQSYWRLDGSGYLTASSTGWNVGIGTTTPSAKLEVTGTFKSGVIYDDHDTNYYLDLANNNALSYSLKTKGSIYTEGDLTVATSSATKMRSNSYCDASGANCFNPSSGWSSDSHFVTTTASYDGNRGGYVSANGLCAAVVPGSHVCATIEILSTIRAGLTATIPVNSIGIWISNGPPGFTVNANDCIGYTSSASNSYGAIWVKLDAGSDGYGSLRTCNNTAKFACCK